MRWINRYINTRSQSWDGYSDVSNSNFEAKPFAYAGYANMHHCECGVGSWTASWAFGERVWDDAELWSIWEEWRK